MDEISKLYKLFSGTDAARIDALPKAGSNRQYFRLTSPTGESAIGVASPDVDENCAFIYLSRHLASHGLPVPRILAVSADCHRYLQTDLGRKSLYDCLRIGRESGGYYSKEEINILKRTIRLLPHLQVEGARGLDANRLLQPNRFDARAAMFDLNYFKYCFLRPIGVPFPENSLQDDFDRLAADLAAPSPDLTNLDGSPLTSFLYRDFQARNVMLRDGNPHFIDFQGGKIGPLHYDLASFLWQASARYPEELRSKLIDVYLNELKTIVRVDTAKFRRRLRLFVLFRLLQVLGAYGLRGLYERKPYFINSIPLALANLRDILDKGTCRPYRTLAEVLNRLVDLPFAEKAGTTAVGSSPSAAPSSSPTVAPSAAPSASASSSPSAAPSSTPTKLVVRIFSFSYKRGIPADTSGNGGGYVFDCRSTNNPGRYEAYKHLTGLDAPVIKFLEDDGEITRFLTSIYALADKHVERYLQRGFTDLMFSFGCTGGQHRSVYSAEHLALHLNARYGVEVRLCHREQGISRTLPAHGVR